MKRTRTYTVVGQMCDSRAQAVERLKTLRGEDPDCTWGLVKIICPKGESPRVEGRLSLPVPPAVLKRIGKLLADKEVRRTPAGKKALELVRAELRR